MRAKAAILLALAVVLPAGAARAGNPPAAGASTYTVHRGETCDQIAAKLFGDPKKIDILHRLNPGLGPPPHHLQEGQILVVLAGPATAAAPDARLATTRNQVEVEAPAAHPGHVNDPLYRGNRVQTGEASAAGVTFRDDTKLYLGEHTLVVILGETSKSAQTASARLESGELRAHLGELAGKKPPQIDVAAGTAKAAVGPGDVKVSVDEAKAARLAVYHGQSSLTARLRTVKVAQGFGSKAESGKAPTPPRPLPLAAIWASAPPALRIVEGPTADVEGVYAPGAAGADVGRFHVQLARDAAFDDPIVDQRTPAAVTRLEAKQLPPGSYFARVSVIDADKFEGPYGPVAETRVVSVVPKEAAGRFTLEVAPPGAFCGLDGGPLAPAAAPYAIDGARAHRVRCALDTSGGGAIEVVIPAPAPPPPGPPPPAPPAATPPAHAAAAPPPAPPLAEEKERARVEALLLLEGFDLTAPGFGVAGGVGADIPFSWGDVGVAAQVGYEGYAARGSALHENAADLGLRLRAGLFHTRLRPYLALTPQIVFESAQAGATATSAGSATLGGLTEALGVQLRAGDGAFSLEGGMRETTTSTNASREANFTGLTAALGYTIGF